MTDLAEEKKDEELELDTDSETDTGDEVIPETEEEEGEELVLQIDGESPAPVEESSVIRTLRQKHKDTAAENKRLREQLESLSGSQKTELGEKPSIEDFEFDTEGYENALSDWIVKKQSIREEEKERENKQKELEAAWSKRLQAHEAQKKELPFANVEEAEIVAKEIFSETQIGMIKDGATNSALLIHALGTNPEIAERFSKIDNPVQFAFTVGKWEEKVGTTKRKASTKPETKIVGQSPVSDDKILERLRAEAAKSGDTTKVTAYRLAQRQKTG